jgi:hypothetical protein
MNEEDLCELEALLSQAQGELAKSEVVEDGLTFMHVDACRRFIAEAAIIVEQMHIELMCESEDEEEDEGPSGVSN